MNKRAFQLDGRLQAIASLVRKGEVAADIGTDHAYLPVRLVLDGVCPKCFACDIHEGPLAAARDTISRYGCEGKVVPLLGDGLEKLDGSEVDVLVLAGMGGELILSILLSREWVRQKRLILQPMTAAEDLRAGLYQEGFAIQSETGVSDHGKVYTVIQAAYTGVVQRMDTLFGMVGLMANCHTPAGRAYLQKQYERTMVKARGLGQSKGEAANAQAAYSLAQQIAALLDGMPQGL